MEMSTLDKLYEHSLDMLQDESCDTVEMLSSLETDAHKQLIVPVLESDYEKGIYLETLLSTLCEEKERFGFKNGFVLATKIWTECS